MDSHNPMSGNVIDVLSFIADKRGDVVGSSSISAFANAKISDASKSLLELKDMIKALEIRKYPTPPFSCQYRQIQYNGKPTKLMTVKYDSIDNFSSEQLSIIQRNSVLLRKLNLLAGILYMLDMSDMYLVKDKETRNKIRELINKYIQKAETDNQSSMRGKINNLNPQDDVGNFIDGLIVGIVGITNQEKDIVLRQVRNAEQYFIAENNSNRIIMVETSVGSLKNISLYQVDIPLGNHLTIEQKRDYVSIYANSKPHWFDRLDNWEKDWLLAFIPNEIDGDWSRFENLFQTSAMQHLPGIKNARSHYLLKQDTDGGLAVISSTTKVATLVPYDMPESLQVNQAYLNAQQLLSTLGERASLNFKNIWGDIFKNNGIYPMVLIQSLLSDSIVAAADADLTEKQKSSIQALAKNMGKDAGLTIVSANDPVNILRAATVQNDDRWKDVNSVLTYADVLIQNLPDNLKIEKRIRISLINSARDELMKLKSRTALNRVAVQLTGKNYEAYKTAYLSVLVEALGGAVSTNCKSGKDRTGLHELYHDAMLVFFERYQYLPSYGSRDDRKEFKEIFKRLFNSMKAHEAAAANTPGSFGLKDSAKMLCKDIAFDLGDSYLESNKRADMNKPASFITDESKQHREVMSGENKGADRQLAYEFESLLVNVYKHLELMLDRQHPLSDNENMALFEAWEKIQLLLNYMEKLSIPLIKLGDSDNREVINLMKIISALTKATCIEDIKVTMGNLRSYLSDDNVQKILSKVLSVKASRSQLTNQKSKFNLKNSVSKLDNESPDFISTLNVIIDNLPLKSTVPVSTESAHSNYASQLTGTLVSDANSRSPSNFIGTKRQAVTLSAPSKIESREIQRSSESTDSSQHSESTEIKESNEIIDVMKDIYLTLQEIQKTLNEMLRLLTVLKSLDNSDKGHVALDRQGLFHSNEKADIVDVKVTDENTKK